jgi:hypothetical protein
MMTFINLFVGLAVWLPGDLYEDCWAWKNLTRNPEDVHGLLGKQAARFTNLNLFIAVCLRCLKEFTKLSCLKRI